MKITFSKTARLAWMFVIIVAALRVDACTSFFLAKDGEMILGCSLDWNIDDGFIFVNKRNVTKRGLAWFSGAPTWTSKYGSLTVNQWGREFPARGMNEAGLVFAEMQLLATTYPKADSRAPLAMTQWTQYMLDNCATVEEVLAAERQVRINPDQYTSHFLFADRNGHSLTVEWLNGKLVAHTGDTLPISALSNDPYQNLLEHYHTGEAPVAGDISSMARFYNAADMMAKYQPAKDGTLPAYALTILDKVHQPGWTQWKLAFDVGRGRLIFHTRKNLEFRYVEMGKMDFSPSSPAQMLDLNAMGSGDMSGAFTDFSYNANRNSLIVVAQKSGYGVDPAWLKDYYNLPGTTTASTSGFYVAGVTDLLPGGDTTLLVAPTYYVIGGACQWQINAGSGWKDLGDDPVAGLGATVFSGATTGTLAISHAAAELTGVGFRFYFPAAGSSWFSVPVWLTVALPPSVSAVPVGWVEPVRVGESSALTASPTFVNGNPGVAYQWQRNGSDVPGATRATLALANVQPADAGLYAATATGLATKTGFPAILGIATADKISGAAEEVGPNLSGTNGNVYDQVLLQGAAATITADAGQITRLSFVDLTNDIVQVEFSGAGTLSLVLDHPTGPASPINYNQTTAYMQGHAGIVITGADETTNVSVFSVGRATAVNQALFRSDAAYDGLADLAFIAIASPTGKFGGVRTANASYFATNGLTGLYAPGVQFTAPVFIGNINAFATATPVLILGSAADVRITGGDLQQANGQPVMLGGIARLAFTAGSDSQGNGLPAKSNRALLQESGVDVTARVVAATAP